MDRIHGIQRAIDYIEEHITEESDYEAIAREAYSSPFYFQRVFGILCGYTVGEYIRNRRLSLAAEEIAFSDAKVIDTALKYGYDSPESFTRAFTRFHGVTPTEARRGKKVRSFSRLSVKLILTGGTTMDYRIEKLDGFKVIGKRKQVTKPQGDTATEEISRFWGECNMNGTVGRICGYIPERPVLRGLLGICFSSGEESSEFPYAIGVEYDGKKPPEGELEVIDIPAQTYAVFECRGKMPDAFGETYKRIVTEFFPQSDRYEYGGGAELEVYPSADTEDPDYFCEIWVAVKEKA